MAEDLKPKTQEEVRAEAEAKRLKAEAKAQQEAALVHDGIWKQFADDLEKGRSFASDRFARNLATFASKLVPYYFTDKELASTINEALEHVKGEDGRSNEDPAELMGKWLRGEAELSRIPLEKDKVM